MTIQAAESDDVGNRKSMSTNATLATNGLLTIVTQSKSRHRSEALRGHVVVVVYDARGNAIWISQDYKCTTRCSSLDFTCASSGTDSWFEQFPDVVGQYAATLDIVHDDEGLGQFVGNVRNAIKTSAQVAQEIRDAARAAGW